MTDSCYFFHVPYAICNPLYIRHHSNSVIKGSLSLMLQTNAPTDRQGRLGSMLNHKFGLTSV